MNTVTPYPINDIVAPGDHDALCGRGGHTIHWSGNIKFRALVEQHRGRYHSASRVEKGKVVAQVVEMWRKMTPPGRFLTLSQPKLGDDSPWQDIGDKAAQKKTAKRLRESLPEATARATATSSASICSSSDDAQCSHIRNNSNVSTSDKRMSVRRVSNESSMRRAAKRVRLEFSNVVALSSFKDQASQVSDEAEKQLMTEEYLDLDSLFDEMLDKMPLIDSLASGITSFNDKSWVSTSPAPFSAYLEESFLQEIAGSIPSAATLTDGDLFD